MFKKCIFFMTLFLVVPLISMDHATQDLLILTRLFQGEQEVKAEGEATVNSQFVDPYSQTFEEYLDQGKEEAAKIKKVYNLAAVHKLLMAKWHWQEKQPGKLANTLSLKQTTLSIQMEQLGANRFKITVVEGADLTANPKELLSTEFFLPPSHTTIFGFRDSQEKIFFLSFHLQGTAPSMDAKNFKPISDKIITKTMPPFPKSALAKKIEGTVIIKGQFNDDGAVIPQSMMIVAGHPMFNDAAKKALTELRYDPQYTPVPLNKVLLHIMFRFVGEDAGETYVLSETEKVKASKEYLEQMNLLKEDEKRGLTWLTLGILVKPNRK